ncbi:MAG: hypothetical protein Q8Q52_05250 [Acidimicrobiia bacterium]|nr:hypothetical protein [Acidimicrobiia bacterium]
MAPPYPLDANGWQPNKPLVTVPTKVYNTAMTTPTVFNHQLLLQVVLDNLKGHDVVVNDEGWSVFDHTIGASFGLVNLAQSLDIVPEEEWPERVGDWINRLVQTRPTELPDYQQAAARLRIRLAADASQPGWAVHRRICDGLDEMLMLRNDVGCETVNEEQLASWGQPPERVWADARQHTIWDEARERRLLARGRTRVVWVRNSFFASSVLLSLDHLLRPKNPHGALAMVPCRDALLYVEMDDAEVVHDAAAMMEIGSQWYVDGPGSISPDVFWYRPGGLIERVARVENRLYQSCWGSDFSAALAALEQVPIKRRAHRTDPSRS